jgi:hypothetical protein
MEIWKPIARLNNKYEASSQGQIRRAKSQRILKLRRKKSYHIVSISGTKYPVHQLVAEAFWGPCPMGREINHKNGNGLDNRIENLEYVTKKENALHRSRSKVGSATIQEIPVIKRHKIDFNNLTDKELEKIRSIYYSSSTITVRNLAQEYGFSIGKISNILNS